jgi:hypothetical protein
VSATAANGYKGKVYFFEKSNCSWTETESFIETEGSYQFFGEYIKIHDDIAMAVSTNFSSLKVRLFEKINNSWAVQDSAKFDDPTLTGAGCSTPFQSVDTDISDSLAILSGITNATAPYKSTLFFQKTPSGWQHSYHVKDLNTTALQKAKILNNQAIGYLGQNRITTLSHNGVA